MSLEKRVLAFDNLASRFENNRVNELLIEHIIPDDLFKRLQTSAALYVCKSIGNDDCVLDDDALMKLLTTKHSEMLNLTPNGMIVPKRHLVLEYNLLASAFISIIDALGINDLISSWHVPLNLRYKDGIRNEDNMKRHHPTEHIHSDSWAGESSASVTVMISIFGDIERNHVSFYKPPSHFEEGWLRPLPTYLAGKEYADQYSKVDFVPRKGSLILSDFAGLHSSTRLEGAGSRLSIDTTFVLERGADIGYMERQWRDNERATPQTLSSLGSKNLLHFPDYEKDWVDSEGGFKHPTNLHVLELQTENAH